MTRIVSGDEAGVLKVWDIASGVELASTQGHAGEVYTVTWHPEGNRIASGGNDNHLVIWDAETLEPLLVLRGHSSYVHSVCFSPDGTLLASGSGDGTVRVWDSVASAQRRVQIKRAEAIRHKAEPIVDRVLKEFADPLDAADAIRADTTLLADLRCAALRILLRRSGQASLTIDRED